MHQQNYMIFGTYKVVLHEAAIARC